MKVNGHTKIEIDNVSDFQLGINILKAAGNSHDIDIFLSEEEERKILSWRVNSVETCFFEIIYFGAERKGWKFQGKVTYFPETRKISIVR